MSDCSEAAPTIGVKFPHIPLESTDKRRRAEMLVVLPSGTRHDGWGAPLGPPPRSIAFLDPMVEGCGTLEATQQDHLALALLGFLFWIRNTIRSLCCVQPAGNWGVGRIDLNLH